MTSNGVESSDNLIEKLELVDRESGLTVWTETVNKASSGDMKDFPLNWTSPHTLRLPVLGNSS